jgi:hypothetical protein
MLLGRYLRQQRFFDGGRVAFVDIGWKGSMQDNVVRAFEADPHLPEVHGLYLGFVDGGAPALPRSFKHGFLADTRERRPEDTDFFRSTSAFEMATTPPHGTTVGYRPGPGGAGAVPVLRHHDLERENAARFFVPAQRAMYAPFGAEDLRPGVLDAVLRYIRYPDRDEAREFLRYSHVESFGVERITRFGLGADLRDVVAGGDRRVRLREVRRAFERNCWREAVVRRSGVPLANLLYDAWWTVRNNR